ncbi:hypothetical protein IQ238_13305 [Pleurocapsales cyanobacterium LEGE 06147]|nr:hypothetical protein [Pleurocapsales cyanobacterium LEGE 06147]
MAHLSKKPSGKSKDVRLNVTSKIWAYATGMLAICIPLSAATDSGVILPITVISGATIGTASVWKFSNQESTSKSQTSNKFKELEGRIADLETIIASGDLNWQQSIDSTANSSFTSQTLHSSSQSKKENLA